MANSNDVNVSFGRINVTYCVGRGQKKRIPKTVKVRGIRNHLNTNHTNFASKVTEAVSDFEMGQVSLATLAAASNLS